jgi:O-antigen/teichoic acid export membrane protein
MGSRNDNSAPASAAQSKRITKNSLVLFSRILVITVINLYAVKLVLRGLGNEDYGVFNAVVGVVMTCSCVFPVLAVSVQRFFSYAMGLGDNTRLPIIFSASINIIVVSLAVLVVLFETIGLWVISEKLQIPPQRLSQAIVIFHFAILTFAFSYIQIPFTAAVFSHEDMNVYALISCVDCVLKLAVAWLIGCTAVDGLVFYGAGLSVVSFITLLFYVLIARHRYAECHYMRVSGGKIYRELLSFSGWTMYGAFAGIGLLQGNNILLNLFFGPLANAAFGVANNIYNAFTSLTNSVVLAFRPRMIQQYAAREFENLNRLFYANNKFILYLLLCAAIPVAVEMPTIMHLWLGDGVSADMITFSRLFIVYTVLLAMHNPITTIMQASGRINVYHLVTETILLCSLPLSWALFKVGMPSYSVFLSMISLCAVAHIARVVCLRHNFDMFRLRHYLLHVVLPGVGVLALSVATAWGVHSVIEGSVARLCVVMVLSPCVTCAAAYAIALRKEERMAVNVVVKKVIKR